MLVDPPTLGLPPRLEFEAFEGGLEEDVEARHVPTANSYENLRDRPLNVGGRWEGRVTVYVSVVPSLSAKILRGIEDG